MQPTLLPRPIHHTGWAYEETVDGYRMVAHRNGNAVQLIKAVVAVAHALLRVVYHVLADGTLYRGSRCQLLRPSP